MSHSKFPSPSKRAAPVLAPRPGRHLVSVVAACFLGLLAACSGEGSKLETLAQGSHAGEAPYWDGGTGTGPAVHHLPIPWPQEELDGSCGTRCGEWLPYTRFQNSLNDPRTKDPSNGGTSPQNYVNIASSCVDKELPSIYYALHKDPTDPAKDVLLFRWRVAQDAHTYATGPSAGAFRSGDPWSSALWTVLFNLDGSGYRTLAAHINGSAGSPSAPVDTVAGIYGKIPTQSINYLDDPENIKLLGTQPAAFVGDNGGLLNFQDNVTPTQFWPEGSTATVWDYGTTRASVVQGPCNEYFIDYQIPVAMLDATSQGGPKVTRSTPISMLFCTANSLNNPFQKDCALNREWTAETNAPGPFGDFIAFDKDKPYSQPLITEVTAKAPSDCKTGKYALTAKVLDALWVDTNGVVKPSVKAVSFWYYQDTNGNRLADDGNPWTKASDATLVAGKLNEWRAEWDSSQLLRGSLLIGAQALDDKNLVDDGMMASPVDNRTFSYLKGDDQDQLYRGAWKVPSFPDHSPQMNAGASEDWYGNPPKVGVQVAGNVVDVTLNNCGSAPSLEMTGVPSQLSPGESVTFSIVVNNTQSRVAVNVASLVGQLPPGFSYSSGTTSGDFGSANPAVSGTSLTWALSPSVQVAAGASKTLVFVATASNVTGSYNAQANATTNAGNISSPPVPLTVSLARASLTQTPSRYSVKPDGATQVTYTLTYANESSVTLSNATLANPLPGGVTYITCTGGSTCSSNGTQVTWQLGTLAAGATGSVTFTITVATTFTATSLTNTARLTATVPGSGTPLERSSSSTIAVEQPLPPVFSLTMTSDKARVDAGGVAPSNVVTWKITYANLGNGAAMNSVLVDTLPAGFTYSSCSVGSSHFTTCAVANGVVTFAGTGAGGIPVGATSSVTVTATVTGTTFSSPNPGVNRATLSATGASSVQAQSPVGVNAGQYCTDTYFFRRAADNLPATVRPASLNPPTATTAYFTSVTPASGTPVDLTFRQELAFPQDTALGGFSPTVNLYMTVPTGGANLRIELYKVNTTTNAKTLIAAPPAATFSLSNTNGVATLGTYQLSTIAAGTTVQSTEKLEWILQFSVNGGSRTLEAHYDSVAEQSRSVLCSTAAPPASLSVSNMVDKARIAGAVEKLTYTLEYANAGGTTASNVLLKDVLPAGMTACEYSSDASNWQPCSAASDHSFPLTSLTAGESRKVYVRGNSPASPTPGQTLVNTATLSSSNAASVTATASTAIAPATSGQPLLVITGAADQKVVGPGATVTYTFTVENVGTGPATGVTVSNAIPADMPWYQYVPGSITGGTSRSDSGSTLSWTLGNLAVGAKATLGFQLATSASGLPSGLTPRDDLATVADSVSCMGASMPAGCTSNTVTVMVNGNADLKLSSSATATSPEPVPPGTFIDYTLIVQSVGSSTANGVVLSDSLPPYTRLESIPEGSGGSYDAATNRVIFPLGNLVPGQLEQRTFRVRVDGSLPVGETLLTNVASVSASNAQVRESSVLTRAKAEPKMRLVSTGPASLPGPAARLAASVSNATTLKVHSAALLEVGGYLRLDNGMITQITDIIGTTVTVEPPVTASAEAGLWRSAVYTLSFANTGNAAAESVDVTSVLPAGWHYVTSQPAATSAPGVGSPGSMRWDLGRIAAGESSSLRVVAIPTLTATLPSTVKDSYFCTVGTTEGCSSSVTTTVGGLIARKKRTSNLVVPAGGSATYTITLENSLGADVTGVTVTDLLPGGFRYRTGSGTPAPTSVNVAQDQPTWSALTVPAGGLEISFAVDVDANLGSGTYDNWLNVVAPPGVGVTPFDALSTPDEDVTVLGTSAFVVTGYIFRDQPVLGVHDNADTGLEGVVVEINGGPAGLFSTQTDSLGYFQRVIRTGATESWAVSVPGTSNQDVLNGLALYKDYSSSVQINPSNAEPTSTRFGYVPTAVTAPPDAVDDALTVAEDSGATPVNVLANDSTAPGVGGQLTVTAVTQPATGGSVTLEDGEVHFTPAPNVNGLVTFTYTVSDVNGNTDTATVRVTVQPVNDPPKAVDDTFSVPTSSGAKTLDVLVNDTSAPDTEVLKVTAVTSPASGGTVEVAPNGAGVVFTPTPGFAGEVTFEYTLSDGNGGTDTATVTVTVVNGPPDAVDDMFSVPTSSGAKTLDVLANDTVDAGEQKKVTAVTSPASGGTVDVAPNGAGVVFTPTPGFAGEVTFTYTLSDGNEGTDTATVTVTVVNGPPDAVDDTFSVPTSSGAKTLDVLANDTVDAGEQKKVTAVTPPASGGTVEVAPNGAGVEFTPTPGFAGEVTFTYRLSDGNGGTDTATVTVTVVNGPPDAVDDVFSVPTNSGAKTLDVLANDTVDAGEQKKVTAVTSPASGGTVAVAPNGAGVEFTPTPGFAGEVTFEYTLSDGNGGTDTATVTVTVVNGAPDAVDDMFSVPTSSGAKTLDVLANDTVDEGEQKKVTGVTQPASGGTVKVAPNGAGVEFTPTPGFAGEVTFEYTLSDGNGGTDTATVTVTVVNGPPDAVDDVFSVPMNSGEKTLDVLANDTVDEGEQKTVTEVTQPASGGTVKVAPNGAGVEFTPTLGFAGEVTFTYTLSDGNGGTDTATVTGTVVNGPPKAVADTFSVPTSSGEKTLDVLANDTVDEGEQKTVTAVTPPATGGTVEVAPNGAGVVFTPTPGFVGEVTFTYTLSDGNGGTDTATVTVTVVNGPPDAVDDMFSVRAGSGEKTLDVLANDTVDAGEQKTVTAVTSPATGGSVAVAPNGAGVLFTPTPRFMGEVTFTYTLSDGNEGTDMATVTVTVVNEPPMAVDDTFSVRPGSGEKTLDVLANDTKEPDEQLTVTAVTQPASGKVDVAPNGTGVVFTPAPGFRGPVTFTYTVSDGNGGTGTATVTVTVVNDPPKAVADTFSVPTSSGAKTLDVLANDTTESDEQLTVTAVTQPTSGGTVSVAPNGTGVVFTPAPGFTGPVTFTYTVSDGNGGTDTVTVTVIVGLDPDDPDDDDDGVLDSEEGLADTDGDGLIDALDPDSDNDGLNDGTERGVTDSMSLPGTDRSSPNYKPDSDPSTTTDPRNPDSDNDGLKDGTEDADHDGSLDDTESDPNDPDSDDGGVSDGEEASYGGNPRDYTDDLAVAGRGCTSTGMGTLIPLALLFTLPLLRRRQSRRDAVAAWGLLGLLVTVLVAAPASAQPTSIPASQGIDVQQFKPGPGLRDVLGVHSPQVGRHLDWNVGLSFNYAKDPLNFLNPRTDTFLYEIVKNQFTFDLMGSVALFDRFELGVAVPITSQGSGAGVSVAPLLSDGVDATGVGDLRLVPKAHLLSTDGGLHLGVIVPVLLPTAGGKSFMGRSGVAAFPRVLGEWTSKEGVRVLANVGLNLQPQEQLYNLNVGNEFAYGLGTEVPFKLGQHRLSAEGTLVGALGLKQTQTEESPLELLGAVKYRFSDALAVHAGGGPGLTRGYGTPGFRLFAGLIWTEAKSAPPARVEPPPPAAPVCPQGPEDLDGFQDDDGCADPDNDGDGLPDSADRCPNQPETKNGFQDEDGCADELPPPPPVDTDGDGLTDDQDRCPTVAEDKDGFQDEDGCPDPDNDKDSVVDASDKCPSEPETINGVDDEDGCPDKGKVKVRVEGQKIVILDKVYFATNKDVILPRSFDLLKQVAAVLRANPEITKVRVEGHTDSQSSDAFNLDLSQRRANNVRKRLVQEEGIAPERLESVGYGESRPVDTNKTAAGRENNRRVEFIILEMEKLTP